MSALQERGLDTDDLKVRCENYLTTRSGRYERRLPRFRALSDVLLSHGMTNEHTLVDVGAGWTEFDFHLRTDHGWLGRYLPIDGGLDATDLNVWTPAHAYDYMVATEVVEHVYDPHRLLDVMVAATRGLVVITTPNPAAVDVLACDPTHVSEVHGAHLRARGWHVQATSMFGKPGDTLFAWRQGDAA